ncbi:MAG: SPOR domain-containing protein [Bacteroidales bacterium]|nr:SPOR domain-containing protein [Bacteroidales bacterium]
MKRLISLLTLLALSLTLTAQSKATAKADALFNQSNFRQAAVEYGKLATAGEKSKKTPPFELSYVYNRLGESFMNLREYAKAEAAFVKAQEKGVKDAAFLLNFGNVLLANNKAERALSMYQQLLATNPENAEAESRIKTVEFHLAAVNNPNVALHPVTLENALNATNNQFSLAWYQGSLLFSSDRAKPAGSPKSAPTTQFFYAQGIYDFDQDKVNQWNPTQLLKGVKTSAPDRALAYDNNTKTYYVMRCPPPAKGKPSSCNILAYRVETKGKTSKLSKPMRQSFHDDNAVIGFPTLSSDGRVMFFTIQKGGRTSIHMSKKTGDNAWSTPIMLSSVINTDKTESYPQLFRDSILFFASNGHLGMGGMDIFYTKISMNGVGHAVSGSSDLNSLEFSTPINLGAPINSGADDVSILVQQNGNGGFFISNRTIGEQNRNNMHRFNQEPHVLSTSGEYLVPRLHSTTPPPGVSLTTEELIATLKTEAPDIIRIIDTVFVNREVLVEKEVFVGGGNEQAILQQNQAQISQLHTQISQLNNALTACQTAAAQQQPMPVSQASTVQPAPAISSTDLVYRVQIAASSVVPVEGEFRATFDALHRAIPNLQMETIYGRDGFYRYVTTPFATFAEADALRRRIQGLGFQSFVSGYRGSERVSMSVR